MTAARWQEVKIILADALEQKDAAERAAFIDKTCADDAELRREVESLLGQEGDGDELESFAEAASAGVHDREAAAAASASANTGRRVGAYELIRELGRGGMGAVWLARRADGRFHQQVAIKLLKRGTDTEEVLRRFRAERQILARLEHPNIARLLDGGETDDGLPFFILELVAGVPLTTFAREANLSIAARLHLFRKVCAAAHFAHQNLVVHRDLKPGNILVTPDGEPKLLDFGIAKLLAAQDADTTAAFAVTAAQHQRLTPAYASPEQVRGEPVTTVSDVYALGTLLYELLTGRPPHRFSSPHPPPSELLRVVGGAEEVSSASLAAADPATRGALRGDLDNIVAMALRKEPARRYPSASALADDLQRYLAGRPVRARPITWHYAAGKFIARHRLAVGAAALLLLSLVIGLGATLRMASVARAEKRRADQRFGDMRRLTHALLFDVSEAFGRGPTAARQLLLRRALESLDKLSAEVQNDADLRRDLATAYQKIGDVQSRLNAANIGDTAGALASYRKALALREELLLKEKNPADARALAADHGRIGDMLSKTGHTAAALAAYRRAVELLEDPSAVSVADREVQRERGRMCDRLGCTLESVGDFAGARRFIAAGRAARVVLAAGATSEDLEAQLDVVRSDYSLAYLLTITGRADEALALERHNEAVLSRLAGEHPADFSLRRSVMDGHEWIGLGLTATGDFAGALAELRHALEIAEETLARDPANTQVHNDLGDVLHETGDALRLAGDPLAATDSYRRSLEHYRTVADADPINIHARRQVAHVEHQLALALYASGDTASALSGLQAVLPQLETLAASDPVNVGYTHDLAHCLADLSASLAAAGEAKAGQNAASRALSAYEELARRVPEDVRVAAERTALRTRLRLPTDEPREIGFAKPALN